MPATSNSNARPKSTKTTRKARKTSKNQPITFQESLVPTMPLAPALPRPAQTLGMPHLSDRALRSGIVVVWIMAMVAAGAGLGLLMRSHVTSVTPPPVPIASASINVAATPSQAIAGSAKAVQPELAIAPSQSVDQARAGQPFAAAGIQIYQSTADLDALQPGYWSAPSPQGTRGTDPIE